MRRYKNNGGLHVTEDGRAVPFGEVFTGPDDLCAKFPYKFEDMGSVEQPGPILEPNGTGADAESGDVNTAVNDETVAIPEVPKSAPLIEGKNVTDEFPLAVEHGMTVMKTGPGWCVYSSDGEAIHDEPLRKKDVPGVIKEWIEG